MGKYKISIFIIVVFILMTVFTSCEKPNEDEYVLNETIEDSGEAETEPELTPIILSGVLPDRTTGEQTVYSMEILTRDEISNKTVGIWLDGIVNNSIEKETDYYTLFGNRNSPFEMYLYLPSANVVMGDISMENVKVTESDSTLLIYINTDSQIKHTKESKDLIFHIYVTGDPEAAGARSERLNINNRKFNCINATFTTLN